MAKAYLLTLVMHANDTGNFYQRYLRKKVLILLLINADQRST